MYVPKYFQATDEQAFKLIGTSPLATLITSVDNTPLATHLPMSLSADQSHLLGHFGRANPQWQHIGDNTQALAVFQGADHYISPNWYPSKSVDGKAVPTWNYISAHVSGTVSLLHEKEQKIHLLEDITDKMESHRDGPWGLSDAPDEYINRMLNGIVGIRLDITTIEGQFKLSQNKTEDDKQGVIDGLRTEETAAGHEIADKVEL